MTPLDINDGGEIALRLGVAACSGALIGVNRDLHHKPAGLRVMALVAIGSAVITMAGIAATADPQQAHDTFSRTTQGILAGIGFLGAGVILRRQTGEQEVHGLTTAASIWMSCILGVVAGLGQWLLGGIAFVMAMGILIAGRAIEHTLLLRASPSRSLTEVKQEPNNPT